MTLINSSLKQRDSNFELFRIILMIFIVAHHYVVNSGIVAVMEKNPFAPNALFLFLFGAWGKTAINCFVMITGYFMCKSQITLRKFLKLIAQIEFYNIIIYFVFVLSGYTNFSFSSLFEAIIPVKHIDRGFISAFIVFFLFIPFLNILLHNLDEKKHRRLILLCLFLYTFISTIPTFSVTMNYVSWFIVVYFIASFIRLYPKKCYTKRIIWGLATLIALCLSCISIVICLYFGVDQYYFIADSNKLFAVVTAFCAFMYFKNIHLKYNKVINLIASASFGVLLIHANSDTMRQWLWRDTLHNVGAFTTEWCYLHFACSVIGVYVICTVIDLLRLYLLEKPLFKLFDKFIFLKQHK